MKKEGVQKISSLLLLNSLNDFG